jgi:hypothetical protein
MGLAKPEQTLAPAALQRWEDGLMRSLGWSWIGRRHLRFGRHGRLTGRLAAEDDEPIAEPTTRIAVVLNTWIGRSQAITTIKTLLRRRIRKPCEDPASGAARG